MIPYSRANVLLDHPVLANDHENAHSSALLDGLMEFRGSNGMG